MNFRRENPKTFYFPYNIYSSGSGKVSPSPICPDRGRGARFPASRHPGHPLDQSICILSKMPTGRGLPCFLCGWVPGGSRGRTGIRWRRIS